MPAWYSAHRREVARLIAAAPASAKQIQTAPSGRFRLEVSRHPTRPGCWDYTSGRVYRDDDEQRIALVERNFSHFPFSWCEQHPSGHSYLICGEDYQGQTIVELDTCTRVDHIPPEAKQGNAFCWAAHYPSPDGRFLFVDGCIWGGSYELILFDFSNPLSPPYPELRRWPVWEVKGFRSDGSFEFEYEQEVRRSDDQPVDDLDTDEYEAIDLNCWDEEVRDRKLRVVWRPDGHEEVVEVD